MGQCTQEGYGLPLDKVDSNEGFYGRQGQNASGLAPLKIWVQVADGLEKRFNFWRSVGNVYKSDERDSNGNRLYCTVDSNGKHSPVKVWNSVEDIERMLDRLPVGEYQDAVKARFERMQAAKQERLQWEATLLNVQWGSDDEMLIDLPEQWEEYQQAV